MGSDAASWRFGQEVRAGRQLMGISQAQLADEMRKRGLAAHPTTVAKIEAQDVEKPRSIRLDEALVLSQILGISLDALRAGDRDQELEELIDRYCSVFLKESNELMDISRRLQAQGWPADVAASIRSAHVQLAGDFEAAMDGWNSSGEGPAAEMVQALAAETLRSTAVYFSHQLAIVLNLGSIAIRYGGPQLREFLDRVLLGQLKDVVLVPDDYLNGNAPNEE